MSIVTIIIIIITITVREEAGVQDTFLTYEVYKDEITLQLVAKACKLLGKLLEVSKSPLPPV